MGLGLLRVGWSAVPFGFGGLVVEGRKRRTTGAEGSFGSSEADGLRVQRCPHINFVLAASSPSESDSDSDEEEDVDDVAAESSWAIGCVRSSCPVKMNVSM